jgi:uncharacterized SAM-binding protein YcdF (DUF218 family)
VEHGARRRIVRILACALAVFIGYVGITGVQVWWSSRRDCARPAEAIVVLGAAQYDGRPSPVLAARLAHVVDLYDRGFADYIVVTGGSQPGDRFTEAGTSARYLADHGVPGARIERETTGATSYQSLASVARFLRRDGIDDVILVSDPYHARRIAAIAAEVGLTASVSPTPTSPFQGWERVERLARETGAVALGRLIGFRRLDRLTDRDPLTTIVG